MTSLRDRAVRFGEYVLNCRLYIYTTISLKFTQSHSPISMSGHVAATLDERNEERRDDADVVSMVGNFERILRHRVHLKVHFTVRIAWHEVLLELQNAVFSPKLIFAGSRCDPTRCKTVSVVWFAFPGQNINTQYCNIKVEQQGDPTSHQPIGNAYCFQLLPLCFTPGLESTEWILDTIRSSLIRSEEALLQPVHHGSVLRRPCGEKVLVQPVQLLGHVVLRTERPGVQWLSFTVKTGYKVTAQFRLNRLLSHYFKAPICPSRVNFGQS